jgi:hypothetical protein
LTFAGFVLVELVLASGQFWDSTFGDGRTYVDAYLLAVVLLLATPARTSTGTVTRGAHRAQASLEERLFAADRVVTSRQLRWLAAVAAAALIVVARRRILFE